VVVELGERSYPIEVGTGLLAGLGRALAARFAARRVHLVTNPTVGALYGEAAVASLEAGGFEVTRVEMPDGEEHKHLGTFGRILDQLLETRPERSWPIVALGGGVVGDVAGFAAASLLRGVPFVQVPTTLLALVDSSVGGKTGVNHALGKNLIGAFYQPSIVLIDLDTLASLPRRELLAGLAEVVKTAVILDADLFALLENRLDGILALDPAVMGEVVAQCCRIKARVVTEDERESGLRAVLNFGHTLGHAVESLTGYSELLHGEAVAIGMAFAARLSQRLGACEAGDADRVVALLERAGLPVRIPASLASDALADAVAGDKKVSGGQVKFVLMTGLGTTRFERLGMAEIATHVAALRDR
jgi:3-dehydroquinate synthase